MTPAIRTEYGSRLRVGDAERESAAKAIGEHFAAGRLDYAELDERIEAAWRARTRADLDALFVDLPHDGATVDARPARSAADHKSTPLPARGPHRRRPARVPVPFIIFLIFVAIVLPGPPLLLIPILWLLMMRSFFGRCFAAGSWSRGPGVAR